MRGLVVGLGEVGAALLRVLSAKYPTVGYDGQDGGPIPPADILHIAFPWQDGFVEKVQGYREQSGARLVVVHSTVPVGTTRQIGGDVVHSPVHGVHPHLDLGLRTFVKYVGAVDPHVAHTVALYLADAGIRARTVESPETSELSKLFLTTVYGLSILACKEMARECARHGVPMRVAYEDALAAYNDGYRKLGMGHVAQPILEPMPGTIGGHCVRANGALLGGFLGDLLGSWDDRYRDEP